MGGLKAPVALKQGHDAMQLGRQISISAVLVLAVCRANFVTTNHFGTDWTFTMAFLTMCVRWRLPRRLVFRIIDGGFGEEVAANRKGEELFCMYCVQYRAVLAPYSTRAAQYVKTQPSLHFRDRSLVRQNFIPTVKMRFMQPPSRKLRTEGCPSHDDGKKALFETVPWISVGSCCSFLPLLFNPPLTPSPGGGYYRIS